MRGINIILSMALGLGVVIGAGCSSTDGSSRKESAEIRLHLETNYDRTQATTQITVLRSNPFQLGVATTPIIELNSITNAFISGSSNAFRIVIELNPRGTRMLESAMMANRGKRIAVYALFTEERWLAAPRVAPISNGVFAFTPDATYEESQYIVRGLMNEVKKLKRAERGWISDD